MKVLVCGGRDFRNYTLLDRVLFTHVSLHDDALICGYDPADKRFQGADQLAWNWAGVNGVIRRHFPARWDDITAPGARVKIDRAGRSYNANAGPDRNQLMADEKPDICIAFPGGAGTADMVRRARKAGIGVVEIKP